MQPVAAMISASVAQRQLSEPRHLADLDLVHVVVAADEQHLDLCAALCDRSGQHEHLTVRASGRLSSAATSSHVALPGVGTLRIGLRRPRARTARRQRFGLLDVRRVVGRRAVRDRVLARFGEHLELVRCAAADRAGVGVRPRGTSGPSGVKMRA